MAASVLQKTGHLHAGCTRSEVNTVEQATVIRLTCRFAAHSSSNRVPGDIILEIQRAPDEDPLPAICAKPPGSSCKAAEHRQGYLGYSRGAAAQVKYNPYCVWMMCAVSSPPAKHRFRHGEAKHEQQSTAVKSLPRKMRCSNRRFHHILSAVHNPILSFLHGRYKQNLKMGNRRNAWSAGTPREPAGIWHCALRFVSPLLAPLILIYPFITADEREPTVGSHFCVWWHGKEQAGCPLT